MIIANPIGAARTSPYVAIDAYANIVANYPAASYVGGIARASDLGKAGVEVISSGSNWIVSGGTFVNILNTMASVKYIVINSSGLTYSQSGTTVTVTATGHGFTAATNNGASIYLTQSTGALVSGWFTNLTYVDANTFTCTSTVSQTTSGNLGANSAETFMPTFMAMPDGLFVDGTLYQSQISYMCKSTAGNKTVRTYFGSYGPSNSAVKTTGSFFDLLSSNLFLFSSSTSFFCGATQGLITMSGSKDFKGSLQIASAGDWAMAIPSYVQIYGA